VLFHQVSLLSMFIPPIGKTPGVDYLEGMGIQPEREGYRAWLPSRLRGPNFGPSGCFSAAPNSAWNYGT